MDQQTSIPQPPSEVKKFNRLIAVAIMMLLLGVAIGVVGRMVNGAKPFSSSSI